jgi:hypothetical protein
MTWSLSISAASKAAAKVALTVELPKAMLHQKPHARDFDMVRNAINAAIDACEEGAISVSANGSVSASGWDNPVPAITGVHMQLNVNSSPAA